MKKAYVKPVFMAEFFEVSSTVAVCPVRSATPLPVEEGDYICDSPGHAVGHAQAPVNNYWDYATNYQTDNSYIFTSGTYQCDFLWNSEGGNVGVWTQMDESGASKGTDYLVSDASQRYNTETNVFTAVVHWFQDMNFMNFFRGANSTNCIPTYNDGNVGSAEDKLFS